MTRLLTLSLGLAAVCAGGLVFLSLTGSHTAMASAKPIQIRWLISHQPPDIFTRAIKIFSEQLAKETNGNMTVEIVQPADVGVRTPEVSHKKIVELLESGDIQLASAFAVPLGQQDPDFWNIGLPYEFRDYSAVQKMMQGPDADRILGGLSKKSDLHALALTLSGGYYVIVSKDQHFLTPEDFKGKKILTSGGPVAKATLQALGAEPIAIELGDAVPAGPIDGIEATYARLSEIPGLKSEYLSNITEPDIDIFSTAMITSNAFFDSLPKDYQVVFTNAARAAAAAEREDSIALNAKTKNSLEQNGSLISKPSPENTTLFKSVTRSVYGSFAPQLSEYQ